MRFSECSLSLRQISNWLSPRAVVTALIGRCTCGICMAADALFLPWCPESKSGLALLPPPLPPSPPPPPPSLFLCLPINPNHMAPRGGQKAKKKKKNPGGTTHSVPEPRPTHTHTHSLAHSHSHTHTRSYQNTATITRAVCCCYNCLITLSCFFFIFLLNYNMSHLCHPSQMFYLTPSVPIRLIGDIFLPRGKIPARGVTAALN